MLGAALLTPDGTWQSEHAERSFIWASVGKLATAAVIMQLAQEGALDLDTPVSRYVDGVPDGDDITLSMLLSHTSGLRSANEIVREEGLSMPTSLGEELALVADRGSLFCPGSAWRYSNTGYAVLGAVIEAVDGGNYALSVERRLFDPLDLTSLRIVTDRSDEDFVPASPDDASTPFHPAVAGAAGSLVGQPLEVATLLAAMLDGRLLDRSRLRELTSTFYPMFDQGTFYAQGIMRYRFPGRDGGIGRWIGHSGGAPGAKAIVAMDENTGNIVAAALTGDGSAEATANLLFRTAIED